jgi:hypothetical protein
MLRHAGHDVHDLTVDNADFARLARVRQVQSLLRRPDLRDLIGRIISEFRPDIVYCNNLFPAIPASAMEPAREARIPVVQVVRNYRRSCIAGTLYRNDAICTQCVQRGSDMPGVVHGCYSGSRTASLALAGARKLQALRDSHGSADLYIAVSHHVAAFVAESGVSPDAIAVQTYLKRVWTRSWRRMAFSPIMAGS